MKPNDDIKVEDLVHYLNTEKHLYGSCGSKRLYLKFNGNFEITVNGKFFTETNQAAIAIDLFNNLKS